MGRTGSASSGFRDPITFEVYKNGLLGLADEMGLVMVRTAHSINANSMQDFSTAICDAEGRVVAQGNTILLHLGTISGAVTQVVSEYDGRINPGDVYIFNETEAVAQHLNDFYLIRPCHLGEELIGFVVCVAHQFDVGGRVAGNRAPDSTEIFQEGLQIPLVKLMHGGLLDETLKSVILQNVRLPDLFWGDIEGQLASCHVGALGLTQLAVDHSPDGMRSLNGELLDYTERLTRQEIRAIPDGEYRFEDWLDDDGAGNGPVGLKVTIRVKGDNLEVDWTGSSPQLRSALNCPMTNTRSAAYGAIQGAFSDEIPSNEGFYRPITVTAPRGSVMNPIRPAAHASRGITAGRMIDVILGALAPALPSRIPAAGDGGLHIAQIAGTGDDGRPIIAMCCSTLESWGGRPGIDGIDGTSPFQSNHAAYRIEDLERDHGVTVLQRALIPDSGGPGRWRGGLGNVQDVRFLGSYGSVIVRYGRRDFPAYGLAGGKSAPPTAVLLNPGTVEERLLPLSGIFPIKRGDVIRVANPGGGGYGDPGLRDREAIRQDIIDEKITIPYAEREYSVTVDPVSLDVSRDRRWPDGGSLERQAPPRPDRLAGRSKG